MKKLIFVFSALLLGYAASAQNTEKLVDQYLVVKDALVTGNGKSASQALSQFQQDLKEEGDFSQKAALLKAVDNMAKTDNIDKQRAAFNDVSSTVWKIVKASEKGASPLYYQYCPMKKAYWVSKDKDIKNPYFGSSMLTCGKVSETK